MFESLKYNMKHNRKSVMKNTTAWFIFGAIILVFVFFGLTPQHQGVAEGGAAATVNGHSISILKYNEAMERMRQDPRFEQLQALGGDAGRQILQNQAISQLVEMELINQATAKAHVTTPDAEVREVLMAIPQFQENGQFKPSLYRAYLDAVRKAPSEFEDDIRRDQALRRVVRMFTSALQPLPHEKEKMKALQGMKANIEFVSVPTEALVIPETISQATVKEFLAKPENETKVKDYYTSHPQEFATQEQVKAQHILIRTNPDQADSDKAALAKIQDLANRAKKEDFGKLASQFSEDPGSKAKSGTLDFFSRGKMVPQFEEVAFSSPVGQISQPVKTEYGYHLIKVLEKKPAQTRTLEQAREEIASQLIAKDQSRAAIEALQASLSKGDSAAVNKFVTDHKLKWEESGAFSIDSTNVPKIGPNEEVAKIAFSLSPEKPVASTLVREGARAFLVRHKAVPADKNASKAASDDAMSEMMAARGSEDSLRQWVDGLRKEAQISMNPAINQQVQ